jgi:hypothetical protein
MSLKIFGADEAPKPRQTFKDDVVGRFRSGYQINNRPQALTEWRVTTDDISVADAIAEAFGGKPQEWDAKGGDNIEVFTEEKTVDIIIESPSKLRQRLILWGRSGKPILVSDGETLDNGEPDPDAGLSLAERKQKARDGVGPEPSIELYFRLADEPDLGIFKFQSGSWSLATDLARDGIDEALEEIDGPARATLGLEEVSFVAKQGPRAGSTVQYTKPRIKVKGAAKIEKGGNPW